jgi:hypothetical protein
MRDNGVVVPSMVTWKSFFPHLRMKLAIVLNCFVYREWLFGGHVTDFEDTSGQSKVAWCVYYTRGTAVYCVQVPRYTLVPIFIYLTW